MPNSGTHARVSRTRILFADPDDDTLFAYQSIATSEGFDVELARDGHEAIALAHVFMPDVIVLDIRLRPGDGFDLIRKLKAGVHTRNLPILVVTDCEGDAFDEQIAASGCSACLTKPCSIRGMLELVTILAMADMRTDARANANESQESLAHAAS